MQAAHVAAGVARALPVLGGQIAWPVWRLLVRVRRARSFGERPGGRAGGQALASAQADVPAGCMPTTVAVVRDYLDSHTSMRAFACGYLARGGVASGPVRGRPGRPWHCMCARG